MGGLAVQALSGKCLLVAARKAAARSVLWRDIAVARGWAEGFLSSGSTPVRLVALLFCGLGGRKLAAGMALRPDIRPQGHGASRASRQ
jgi:hypothetical protein